MEYKITCLSILALILPFFEKILKETSKITQFQVAESSERDLLSEDNPIKYLERLKSRNEILGFEEGVMKFEKE